MAFPKKTNYTDKLKTPTALNLGAGKEDNDVESDQSIIDMLESGNATSVDEQHDVDDNATSSATNETTTLHQQCKFVKCDFELSLCGLYFSNNSI